MSLRKDTINGNRLAAKWGIDIHVLSYLIIKYDLSVLDPPKNFMSKLFFKPNNFRIDVDKILKIMTNGPFIFNLGHGIVPQTPPENVGRVVEMVQNFKK